MKEDTKMGERKHYSAEEKAKLILEIIQNGKKISEVAEENNVHPNQLMTWKKQFLESAVNVFKTERKDITAKAEAREIQNLKDEISRKDSVIAELAGENLELKKNYSGLMSKK